MHPAVKPVCLLLVLIMTVCVCHAQRRTVDMSVKRVRRIGEEPPRDPEPETWQRSERNARLNLPGNPKAALEFVDRAIRLADSPQAFTACFLTKAEIYRAQTNRIHALRWLQQALERADATDKRDVYDRLYAFYMEGDDYRKAELFFTGELENKPDRHLQTLLGKVFNEQKAFDKAEPLFQEAVRNGYEPAILPLAAAYLASGKSAQAEALLTLRCQRVMRQGVDRTSDNVQEIIALAYTLIRTKGTDEAGRLIRQESPYVNNSLGSKHPAAVALLDAYVTVCLLQGHFDEAERWRAEANLRRAEANRRRTGQDKNKSEETYPFADQSFAAGQGLKTVHELLYRDKIEEAIDFADAQIQELETYSAQLLLPLFLFQTGAFLLQRADFERRTASPNEEVVKNLLLGKKEAAGTRKPNGALHCFVKVAVRHPKSAFAKDACLHEDEILTLVNTRYGVTLPSSIPANFRAEILNRSDDQKTGFQRNTDR